MTTRKEVYAAIDSELAYAEARWRHSCTEAGIEYRPDDTKLVEEWLMFILGYYHDAVSAAAHKPGPASSLEIMRKLAALCVRCMTIHGGYRRGLAGSEMYSMPGPLTLPLVYGLIDGERTYQDRLPLSRTDGKKRTPCGYLCMFYTYLNRAINGWTENPGDNEALRNISKLAGIAVHCMEDHGAPMRPPFTP